MFCWSSHVWKSCRRQENKKKMSSDTKRDNFGSSSDSDDEASLVVTSLSRTLEGGPPWGFRFIGGSDVAQRIKVIRVSYQVKYFLRYEKKLDTLGSRYPYWYRYRDPPSMIQYPYWFTYLYCCYCYHCCEKIKHFEDKLMIFIHFYNFKYEKKILSDGNT